MKATKIILSSLLCLMSIFANAQGRALKFNVATDLGFGKNSFKAVTPNLSVAYEVLPHLMLGAKVEDAITLEKIAGQRTNDNLMTYGGQVSYEIPLLEKIFILEPRVNIGHTFSGGTDRGYTYYQVGLYLSGNMKDGGNIFGIGFRRNDYKGQLHTDKTFFFVSYGVVFRLGKR